MRAHHRPIVPRYAAVLCCTWLHVFPSLFSVDPVVLPRDNGFGLFCHACHGFCLLTCRRNSALIFPPFSPLAQLLPTRKQAEMEQPNDMEQYYMPSYAYQVIPMPPPVCPQNSFIIFFFFLPCLPCLPYPSLSSLAAPPTDELAVRQQRLVDAVLQLLFRPVGVRRPLLLPGLPLCPTKQADRGKQPHLRRGQEQGRERRGDEDNHDGAQHPQPAQARKEIFLHVLSTCCITFCSKMSWTAWTCASVAATTSSTSPSTSRARTTLATTLST